MLIVKKMTSSCHVLLCEATILALLLAPVFLVDTDQVDTLECIGSTLCKPAIQTCFLYRCDCSPPPERPGSCLEDDHRNSDCWKYFCCYLIPSGFRSVRNVLQVDDFTKLIDGANTTRYRVTLWSKRDTENDTWKNTGNQILTWGKTDSMIPEYLSISDTFPTESPPSIEANDTLSNMSESAGPLLQMLLDECYDQEGYDKMPFECTELFRTTCIVNNCSCWTSSIDFSAESNRTGILLPEYCSVLDITTYDITTSSTLSALHAASNSINEWKNGTFGGWAPADNDTDPWMQFSDIQGNVSGVIIQGMAGDATRTLGKFAVSRCMDTTSFSPLTNETFNHHGGIFNSSTIHYIERLPSPVGCLEIKVLEPNDATKIGFRGGLITCKDVSADYQSTYDIACESGLILVDTLNTSISESEDERDGADSIANTFREVAVDFQNINKSQFAKNFDQKLGLSDIELNIKYQQVQDFKQKGIFELNESSILASDPEDYSSNLIVGIPDHVFVEFPNESTVAMIVGQTKTVGAENDDGNAVINGRKAKIVSPVITLMTLVDDNYTSLDNVSMEFNFEAGDDEELMVASFPELEESENIEWDSDGCTSAINQTTHRVAIQCNHTTSFAVILLIKERQLPEWLEKMADIITKAGCFISAVSLAAALVTFMFFRKKIDNYHFTIHFNLMAALFASLLVFVGLVERSELEIVCQITKYTLQYLFLAVFFWMLCEGIHIYRMIITVFETKTRHILVFYAIGWGLPLILTAITYGSLSLLHKQDKQTDTDMNANDKKDKTQICFLSYADSSIWYFVVPAVTVIAINTYILSRITMVVVRAAKTQTEASARKIHQAKAGVRSALMLMPLLGSTYVLGLAASIHAIFELLFNVVNSLQGFFIALFYCGLNPEIKAAVRQFLQRSQDARSIMASTTALQEKNNKRFKNKIGPEASTASTIIDSEMMQKLHEI